MRTTVTLEDDTAAAVEQLRRERGIGVSAAVNELVRRGLMHREPVTPFVQRTSSSGGAKYDLTRVWDVLELVEGPDYK